jgi:exodeoxyribonuclease VII small subunit
VVKILELGQMSLDESLRYWERGEELAAYCGRYLDGASKKVEEALARRDGEEQGQE